MLRPVGSVLSVHRPIMTAPPSYRLASVGRMTIMTSAIRVTVWGENFHEHFERDRAGMAERYPDGMHGAIAAGLRDQMLSLIHI